MGNHVELDTHKSYHNVNVYVVKMGYYILTIHKIILTIQCVVIQWSYDIKIFSQHDQTFSKLINNKEETF